MSTKPKRCASTFAPHRRRLPSKEGALSLMVEGLARVSTLEAEFSRTSRAEMFDCANRRHGEERIGYVAVNRHVA